MMSANTEKLSPVDVLEFHQEKYETIVFPTLFAYQVYDKVFAFYEQEIRRYEAYYHQRKAGADVTAEANRPAAPGLQVEQTYRQRVLYPFYFEQDEHGTFAKDCRDYLKSLRLMFATWSKMFGSKNKPKGDQKNGQDGIKAAIHKVLHLDCQLMVITMITFFERDRLAYERALFPLDVTMVKKVLDYCKGQTLWYDHVVNGTTFNDQGAAKLMTTTGELVGQFEMFKRHFEPFMDKDTMAWSFKLYLDLFHNAYIEWTASAGRANRQGNVVNIDTLRLDRN